MGYSKQQIADLGETIDRTPCDVVLIGTPIDLTRLVKINKPAMRVRYDLAEKGAPTLTAIVHAFLDARPAKAAKPVKTGKAKKKTQPGSRQASLS